MLRGILHKPSPKGSSLSLLSLASNGHCRVHLNNGRLLSSSSFSSLPRPSTPLSLSSSRTLWTTGSSSSFSSSRSSSNVHGGRRRWGGVVTSSVSVAAAGLFLMNNGRGYCCSSTNGESSSSSCSVNHHRAVRMAQSSTTSSSSLLWGMSQQQGMSSVTSCEGTDDDNDEVPSSPSLPPVLDEGQDTTLIVPPFPEIALSYDHYNGVTVDLGKYQQWLHETQKQQQQQEEDGSTLDDIPSSFGKHLAMAIDIWRAEGRKGIWIQAPPSAAQWIPDCVHAGFDFHTIVQTTATVTAQSASAQPKEERQSVDGAIVDSSTTMTTITPTTTNTPPPPKNTLVLTKWLPSTPSRLPFGPTHQVGVGVVLLNPSDPSQMLVVQEKSGPAAAYQLWKMPTGLLDPGEDVHTAAARELMEETGIDGATLMGIVCFRQAHRPNSTSDLFFVCQMGLPTTTTATSATGEGGGVPNPIVWTPQEDEIADIRWMAVEEYCAQSRWQGSPLYLRLNECILQVSRAAMMANGGSSRPTLGDDDDNHQHPPPLIGHEQLDVGFGGRFGSTNALFLPATATASSSLSSSLSSKI